MIVSVSATTELPAVGTPMFLVLGEGLNFRSRLESVEADTFTVAAPLETAGPAALVPGQEFDIFWAPFDAEEILAQMIRLHVMTWEINERRLRQEVA